jgi:LacI family transcriptional regulator
MKRTSAPRVAVLVDTSTGWGRRLIRGIFGYVNKHDPWDIWLEPRGQNERLRLPAGWRGDGVIARVATRAMSEHLRKSRAKVVNVSAIQVPDSRFPRVTTDNLALVTLAFDHFRDRGIRSFGYVGLPNRAYSLDRQRLFSKTCEADGCPCDVFAPSGRRRGSSHWLREQQSLQHWLQGLPKPVGILTWGVRRGVDVINAARRGSVCVPDEAAVLGGDDDDLICQAVRPSLSGIVVASEQIGHDAAAMLARLMSGNLLDATRTCCEPFGISARNSSDVLALDDPDVAASVRFIRDHADSPLRVIDVAEAVAVSRRSLERRFHRELRRTIGDEIARVHLERAKLLLAQTSMPIPRVAKASGYGSPEYLANVFRRSTGLTPLKYRTRVQAR